MWTHRTSVDLCSSSLLEDSTLRRNSNKGKNVVGIHLNDEPITWLPRDERLTWPNVNIYFHFRPVHNWQFPGWKACAGLIFPPSFTPTLRGLSLVILHQWSWASSNDVDGLILLLVVIPVHWYQALRDTDQASGMRPGWFCGFQFKLWICSNRSTFTAWF